MSREEMLEKEGKILDWLEEQFKEQLLLTRREQNPNAFDTLYIEHTGVGADSEEVLGTYYFLPIDDEEPYMHKFLMGMTITEELDSDALPFIREAISKINYLLPIGAFVVDEKETSLLYRIGLPFLPETGLEEVKTMIGYYLVEALRYVSLWINALLFLNAGTIGMEQFENYVKDCMGAEEK